MDPQVSSSNYGIPLIVSEIYGSNWQQEMTTKALGMYIDNLHREVNRLGHGNQNLKTEHYEPVMW